MYLMRMDATGVRFLEGGYDSITLHAGNEIIFHAARKAQEKINETTTIQTEDKPWPHNPDLIRHCARVVDNGGKMIAEFYGIWTDGEALNTDEVVAMIAEALANRPGQLIAEIFNRVNLSGPRLVYKGDWMFELPQEKHDDDDEPDDESDEN